MKTNFIGIFTLPLFLILVGCSSLATEEATNASAATALAPSAPALPTTCQAKEYHQFDFWIGEWQVTSPNGNVAGKNSIKSILNGCALYESWTSAGGYRGDSINFYDGVKGVWHQTWIDFSGSALYGDGGLVDGNMVLSGAGKDAQGNDIINRITWTPNEDGSVRQLWETSSDAGESWATAFDGLYRKVK